ncbi:MAG: hypothetical protein QMC80_00685, partial [Thermoplasmatales archaeon]|nr:hypothetical protein [Thermoplasmatales archaeon]
YCTHAIWSLSQADIKVFTRVYEWDENGHFVDCHEVRMYTLSSSGNENKYVNKNIKDGMKITWTPGHYYSTEIAVHTHATASSQWISYKESIFFSFSSAAARTHMESTTWYIQS